MDKIQDYWKLVWDKTEKAAEADSKKVGNFKAQKLSFGQQMSIIKHQIAFKTAMGFVEYAQ